MLTPSDVSAVREEFGLSFAEFGERLAPHRPAPDTGIPYTRGYLSNVCKGRVPISESFAQAVRDFRTAERMRVEGFRASHVGDIPVHELLEEVGQIQEVGNGSIKMILVVRSGHPELVQLGEVAAPVQGGAALCAHPECKTRFVRVVPNQKYHAEACRLAHYQLMKEQARR